MKKLHVCKATRLNQATTARFAAGAGGGGRGTLPASPRAQYLVGQFLVQLLGNGVVEFPLKLPRRYAHGVHHLHQDEHPAPDSGNQRARQARGAYERWGSASLLGPLAASDKPGQQLGRPRGRAWGAASGGRVSAPLETEARSLQPPTYPQVRGRPVPLRPHPAQQPRTIHAHPAAPKSQRRARESESPSFRRTDQ